MVSKVIWDMQASKSFKEAIKYIKADSIQSAEKIRKAIIGSTKELITNPLKYPSDKYKLNNDSSFRAYELHRYRITYLVLEDEIKVVRFRHTGQKPQSY